MRSKHLTAEALVGQCSYLFGPTRPDTAAAVAAFNREFGGANSPLKEAL